MQVFFLVIWIVSVIWLLPVLTQATSNSGGFGEFGGHT